jgi:hypothetical protein
LLAGVHLKRLLKKFPMEEATVEMMLPTWPRKLVLELAGL